MQRQGNMTRTMPMPLTEGLKRLLLAALLLSGIITLVLNGLGQFPSSMGLPGVKACEMATRLLRLMTR
jgi:hypothetical protein